MAAETKKTNPNEKYIWVGLVIIFIAVVIFGVVKNGRIAEMLSSKGSSEETAATASNAADNSGLTADERVDALTAEEPESYGTVNSIGDYSNLTLEVSAAKTITSDDVDDYINTYVLPQYLEETDDAIVTGDTVNIDYTGTENGVEFDGGSAEGYDLEIGSGSFIDGFEDGLIGLKKGDETDLTLTFPDDYTTESLAGHTVNFHVVINSVKRQRELDDALAKEIDENCNTVAEYRESIQKQLQDSADTSHRNAEETAVLDKLVEISDITVNEDAVQWAAVQSMKNYKSQMTSYFGNLESYLSLTNTTYDQLLQQSRESADTYLREILVIDAIVEKENIKADSDAIEAYAKSQGISSAMLSYTMEKDAINKEAARYKALSGIVDTTTFTEKE